MCEWKMRHRHTSVCSLFIAIIIKFITILWWSHNCYIFATITVVKVRLFCWWWCVYCIVLLTLLLFYEPAMTTTKLSLVGWLKYFELNSLLGVWHHKSVSKCRERQEGGKWTESLFAVLSVIKINSSDIFFTSLGKWSKWKMSWWARHLGCCLHNKGCSCGFDHLKNL